MEEEDLKHTKTKAAFLVLTLLFLFLAADSPVQVRKVSGNGGDWYYSGYVYRKYHNITGSPSGNLTNYPVQLTIHYGSGTDSGSDVYLNSHSQTDFDDLRFTWYNQTSGSQQAIDYWRESYTDGSSATVWVNLPFISNVTTNRIYIYYGNSSVSSGSNASETFPLLGSDFEGSVDWTYEENVANGWGFYGEKVSGVYDGTPDHSYRLVLELNCPASAGNYWHIKKDITFSGENISIELSVKDSYNGATSGYLFKRVRWDSTTLWSEDVAGDEGWQQLSWTKTGVTGTHTLTLQVYVSKGLSNFPVSVYWDVVRIRETVSNPPSHGGWGSQEAKPQHQSISSRRRTPSPIHSLR